MAVAFCQVLKPEPMVVKQTYSNDYLWFFCKKKLLQSPFSWTRQSGYCEGTQRLLTELYHKIDTEGLLHTNRLSLPVRPCVFVSVSNILATSFWHKQYGKMGSLFGHQRRLFNFPNKIWQSVKYTKWLTWCENLRYGLCMRDGIRTWTRSLTRSRIYRTWTGRRLDVVDVDMEWISPGHRRYSCHGTCYEITDRR